MGVPSSYQVRDPHPIFLERGSGSKVWDVDGSEYRDFHNGFGSMVQGHAHPAIVRAVTERMPLGTHFAAVTEDSVVVAEELVQRWGLPKWRFTNSGSESTMDAIRLARAHTGRELVVKMEGSYHGHHDTVMVSIGIDIDDDAVGPADRPNSVPYGGGIPACTVAQTIPVPFNDADALDARLAELSGQVACVIMEPGMMNIGVVLPQDGYLAAVREITQKHDVLLIFDEVKTGITIAAGGAVERFGVTPDIVTLAKALGRRPAERRDRRQRGGHGLDRGRHRLPGRHLQRQSAEHGGRARELRGGHDAGGLRPPRASQRPPARRPRRDHRASTASRRT